MAAGPTHAVVAPVDLHVVHGADAGVVADGVVAVSGTADAGLLALVDICRQAGPPEAADLRSRPQRVQLLSPLISAADFHLDIFKMFKKKH